MLHLHLKCFATEYEFLIILLLKTSFIKTPLKQARSENRCIKGLSLGHQSKYPHTLADFRNSVGDDFQPRNKEMMNTHTHQDTHLSMQNRKNIHVKEHFCDKKLNN